VGGSGRSGLGERGHRRFLRRISSTAAAAIILAGIPGPLTPSTVIAGDIEQAQEARDQAHPNGRVVEAAPAPITVPSTGGETSQDPTIGGPPLLLPYTPPADTIELADERTEVSRTLANPDGTFTTAFLTPASDLAPLQAGIELALRPYNTADRVLRIPISAIPEHMIVRTGRVAGNVNLRGGGGWEVELSKGLALDLFEVIQ
jgi:hypothetical protein